MKRVFAAIDISDEARRSIGEYTAGLQAEFAEAPVRWEKSEKLHITLKFAGSLDDEELAQFKLQVREAAVNVAALRITVTGTGAFVKRRGPSVLWLGIGIVSGDPDSFTRLNSELEIESKRPFRPHITIARIKDAKNATSLIDKHLASTFQSAEFEATELVIYESKLLPAGSIYSKLEAFPLGEG
jgi:RNA 2',3'-cyclic 3'-phosphodiesterase